MSGVLFGIGLSQRWDIRTNSPAQEAKLYVYSAGTSTPVTAYKNAGLTAGQEHPTPILTDSYGIIPAFWLADGTYRARLVSSDGAVIWFDIDNIPAVGASSGEGAVDTTDPNAIAATGDFQWQPVAGARSGWVRANARTIGSATSGATERANADCENLFLFLWNGFSDAQCPVGTGRGLSAAADWAANKAIGTLDLRGFIAGGLTGMGNTSTAAFDTLTFSVGNGDTAASKLGAPTVTLARANLPNDTVSGNFGGAFAVSGGAGTTGVPVGVGTTVYNSDAFSTLTGTIALNGGVTQTAVNKMPQTVLGSWYIRL